MKIHLIAKLSPRGSFSLLSRTFGNALSAATSSLLSATQPLFLLQTVSFTMAWRSSGSSNAELVNNLKCETLCFCSGKVGESWPEIQAHAALEGFKMPLSTLRFGGVGQWPNWPLVIYVYMTLVGSNYRECHLVTSKLKSFIMYL